jgi:hypothetical protein
MMRFGRTTWLLLAGALPAAIACALPPASAPAPQAASTPAPQGSAASAPGAEGEAPDLVKDVLSYDDLEEQVRFAVACGDKKELSEAAFEDNRRHHTPFARRFDRWDQLILFDRNGNGTISWGEASQYRVALRKALLAAYHADRDGQLTGDERAAANKALAEGRLPPLNPPLPQPPRPPPLPAAPAAATQPHLTDENSAASTQPDEDDED